MHAEKPFGDWRTAILIVLSCFPGAVAEAAEAPVKPEAISLSTVAVHVHDLDAMKAFYSEAFGARFHPVQVGELTCHFGETETVVFKFVPGREAADFEGWPSHQLGFVVPDVERVIQLARKHGGRQEGEISREGGVVSAAVRDPDGNSIELYSAPPPATAPR